MKKKILIVDDSETSSMFLKMALQNYDVNSVTSGREMWKLLESEIPDLILMDIVMPEEDGYSLSQKLLLNDQYKDIPIIFQTTKNSSDDLEKAFDTGAVDYISKPIDEKELRARIKSALKIKELEKELNSALTVIKQDLAVAAKIQNKIIPDDVQVRNGLVFYTKYLPMVEVGGDFYYITEIGSGITRIFLADATGHGVQSALITMLIKSEYENLAKRSESPSELLYHLNETFINKYQVLKTFFSAFVVDVNINLNTLTYASGGHPEQVLVSGKTNTIELLKKTGRLVGVVPETKYKEITMEFVKGDRLYIFTDGLYEEFNEKEEIYGEEELFDILQNNNRNPIKQIIEFILSDLKDFMGTRQQDDDITVIGLEIAP
ncbi:MAG TPA: SpoIIE family protein phosphatase [Leptospiraceae bacterium]|nr:SpoIIE family protein phosphatase [Leptospiraceae bacterium]HMW04773.1 SpoIIE family protein phosphatase [Leptospiraceae bacterium]HMX34533.1 SpoIIE family protein phosphatase [Leptospiraceae bacterium]HMY33053.1 SpoIIE family protein phosphatase [Leptospiraceae bacterium]HMZ65526.1 SpoIIE family protein phosphatase [Leptospiraceae bacterium]